MNVQIQQPPTLREYNRILKNDLKFADESILLVKWGTTRLGPDSLHRILQRLQQGALRIRYGTRSSNKSYALDSNSIYYKRGSVILYTSLMQLNKLSACNAVLENTLKANRSSVSSKEIESFQTQRARIIVAPSDSYSLRLI